MSLDIELYIKCEDAGDGEEHCHTLPGCDWNYTHNVSDMWREAGCYEALYESNDKRAREILPDLQKAVQAMTDDPEKYKDMNPPNGWGDYSSALSWLQEIRSACERYPNARIWIWAY
jgi:hypothetical protein